MLRGQHGYRWHQGALGVLGGVRGIGWLSGEIWGLSEGVVGSEVHWGLSGSVGTQRPAWV